MTTATLLSVLGKTSHSFRLRSIALLLTAAVLWLFAHPYQGIYHDARVYGLLAAHWLHPAALANDLFFRYGSQGNLSLFTPIYGFLVGQIGLNPAAQLVVLSGGVLWIWAVWSLCRSTLVEGFLFRFTFFFGAASSLVYSPNGAIFALNENFATARSWAIPIGLLSVAAQVENRHAKALMLGLGSCALHPLIGLWPLLLMLAARLRPRLLVALGAIALIGVAVLGLLDLPVAGLHLMRGEWLASVSDPQLDIFVGHNVTAYLGWLGCLLLGHRAGNPHWRSLYGNLALIAAIALLATCIVSYWFPIEILVQSQLWRVFWLAIPLGGLALLDVIHRSCRAAPQVWLVWCMAAALTCIYPPVFAYAVLAVWLISCWPHAQHGWVQLSQLIVRHSRWLGAAAIVLWLIALPGLFADMGRLGERFVVPWWEGASWLHGLVAGGTWPLPLLLALGFAIAWRVQGILAVLILPLLFLHWDHRPLGQQESERCYLADCPPHAFNRFIRPGDTVFWQDEDLTVWFRLNAQNYTGRVQGIGRVFSQVKFFEWQRRQKLVAAALSGKQVDLAKVCVDPQLQWVVSGQDLAPWQAVAEIKKAGRTWRLLRCGSATTGRQKI